MPITGVQSNNNNTKFSADNRRFGAPAGATQPPTAAVAGVPPNSSDQKKGVKVWMNAIIGK